MRNHLVDAGETEVGEERGANQTAKATVRHIHSVYKYLHYSYVLR